MAHALTERCRAHQAGDGAAEVRAYRPRGSGSVGRDELAKRVDDFDHGLWEQLVKSAASVTTRTRSSHSLTEEEDRERRGRAAMTRVQYEIPDNAA